MRHVFETMGTVASLDVDVAGVVPAISRVFHEADARFSLFRHTSELSRVVAGSLRLMDSSAQLKNAYASAMFWREQTRGAFSPNRPDGVLDLNGIVKARAIADAARVLRAANVANWSINVGGDLLCSGRQPDGDDWRVGIVDPADRSTMACTIRLRASRSAVATSGSAERGDHIWRNGLSIPEFRQVTVVADEIVTADVLATAIVAGGRQTLDFATERWSIDVFAVDLDGGMLATPGLKAALLA
jgi:thiamine biosynthesis lipoprotein